MSQGSSVGSSGNLTTPNRIYTSTDGENYAPLDLLSITPALNGEGLTGISYADGKFVTIGNRGRILCSTNGLDWVTVRSSAGPGWNRLRYLDGTWAAVGNAGWVAFSVDGQNWSSRTVGAESDLTDIAHQNGQYMIVGSHAMVLLSLPVKPVSILSDSLTKLPGSGMQFHVSGQPGRVLDIQSSSNLVDWSNLLRQTNSTGTAVITDSAPASERRFYRAVQQP